MAYKIFLLFLLFYQSPAFAKYQLCSITINSADEIETFKQFLSPDDFDFVELLPSKINEKQDHSSHWFSGACRKNYHCDILVISGHFGGTFFGESGYSLPTELLEEKACQQSCPGILSQVKEIFLFGCNTLADKKKDHRTYEQYLKVLLDDGMARETAERVVAARYSPLETPFYSRMNFIFSHSDTIYGFDQLSPLGKHIRQPLRKYFQAINDRFGSYANYLRADQHKRPHNSELFQYLPPSAFTLNQASLSLSGENPSQKKFFNNKCLLYDEGKAFSSRMQALKDIFESQQAGSAFFAIDHFLNHNQREVIEGAGRQVFRSIRENVSMSREFLSYYQHLDFLPYIKMVYLNVLEKFQWVDPSELHILRKQDLLEMIKKPGPEAYISLILLLKEEQITPGKFYISKTDLPEDYIQNVWALLIFEKLKALAPDWQADILTYCKAHIKKTPAICHQALNTLAHIQPQGNLVQDGFEFLDFEDESLVYYTIRMLGQSGVVDYHIHKKIASFLKDPSLRLRQEAVEALGFLRTPYTDIQEDMARLLPHSDTKSAEEIFWSFHRMNVRSELAQREIIQYALRASDLQMMKRAFQALNNTSDFSDFALSFFYTQLESRENLEFLFYMIETLSQNQELRDLGIHYRFLLFQQEESDELKQKALQKMTGLTWLHPETQISFLNYLEDDSPLVRRTAVHILRNIKNLQTNTFNHIKTLYQEKGIKELEVFFL